MSALTAQSPYEAYVYAYPHKTAYRALDAPRPLSEVWAHEDQRALSLYVHVPFCEMRCGFCNLFTTVKPGEGITRRYVDALGRQARQVRAALSPQARFARLAIGGGTPSFLSVAELEDLFALLTQVMGADVAAIPTSFELSPETASAEKLDLLRAVGVDRVSIGVQSFLDAEVEAVHRDQRAAQVHQTLDLIRARQLPTLNIDLMYGLPGQTPDSWGHSLREALRHHPEELYLYPLYVRPLTRLGLSDAEWDDLRLQLYRQGRDLLLDSGYKQVSMRMFRRAGAPGVEGPVYCCQEDGMVGLGCGARSYTKSLHYSSAYAVGPMQVKAIIRDWLLTSDEDFGRASWGFALDEGERRRRDLILSLLSDEGLEEARYVGRFGAAPAADFPALGALEAEGLAARAQGRWRLTAAGLERSDAIGPWLFSPAVRALVEGYDRR